ncbi:pseudouridine synthase [Planctomycetaceae bacterium SCGC AG-212-F19]|nr:pseudouridine synthase [Planctomycetaceae bacterium SCGC AG-212-F19]
MALLAPATGFAESPTTPKKGVTIEGITEYRLENGLRILLFPDASSSTVTVNLTVLVGSRHEGYGETGMAHLLEHMVFKGTPTHPDVPKALKEHGAQFNGTTWVDRTNYFETMPATDANLEFGIKLEADRMVNSFVKREDLLSEMTVVRNEFEAGENNPERILSQRMMAVAYEWHNYGKSTIGNRSDIERVPIDRLQAFYRKFYQPDNAVLVVAGKFDEAKALEYIGKYFGALKKPARQLDTTYTEEPVQDGERIVTLRRVGKIGVVGTIYHIPAGAHEDFPALEVLNSILVSEPSGRLYKALVETKKATSVSGVAWNWHDPGVMEFSAEVDPKLSLDAVRDTMFDVVENFGKQKVTEEEVERAKVKYKKNRDLLLARPDRVAITLSEWVSKGDWRLFFLYRDRIAKVTAADVDRVAAKYLLSSNRTLGVFQPTEATQIVRATVPATPDVAELVKDYKGSAAVAAGEVFDPTPENIEKRVKRIIPEKGGVKVALLPKKSRGETVNLNLTLRFGTEKSQAGQTTAAGLIGSMLTRGSEKHTRQQLQDELDGLGARFSVNSGTSYVGVTIEVKRNNLPRVLTLLAEVLQKPTFPVAELDILKREMRDQLQKASTEPTMLAFRAVQRQLNPYPKDDIRYIPTIEEEIARLDAVTVDQLKALYKQVGGQAATLVVIGEVDDPASSAKSPVNDLVKMLNDWKSDVSYVRIERPAKVGTPGARDVILTPDKANAMYVAGHNLAMTDADPDYAALEVANFILGGGTLSSRLGNRVRQKEGLSYGVQSIFSADPKDKAGRVYMYAICNPANVEKVDKAMAEEVEKLIKDGVTATELDEATKSWLERRKVQRSTDGALAGLLDAGLFLDRTFAWHADLEKKVGGLTVADVNAAIRKHVAPKSLIIISAGDFKKK